MGLVILELQPCLLLEYLITTVDEYVPLNDLDKPHLITALHLSAFPPSDSVRMRFAVVQRLSPSQNSTVTP